MDRVCWTVADLACGETQEEKLQCEQSTISRQPKFGWILPGLIDVKGLGRPKESCGKKEDFQQWSKKTEAFFAGVIKESEMMLEWAAEQPTDITTTAIDLEFLPTDTNEDGGVQNLEEFMLQQMHTALMALRSFEANDIVANSLKNPLEACRRLQKRCDPTTSGRKRNLLRTIFLPGRCFFWNSKQGSNAGSPTCRAARRR